MVQCTVANTSVTWPDWMDELIDRRRETDQSRPDFESKSEYVRKAVQARFDAEDAGEWTDPEIEPPDTPEAEP